MNIVLPRLHQGQREVAEDPARFKLLLCGRRWGKTRLGVVTALAEMFKGGHVWWVAPTYGVSGIAWRLAKAMVKDVPGVEVREGDREIRWGRGFIAFKSADRPDNLRGEGLDFVVVDEADFMDGEVWNDVLRPALADRNGRAMLISTPNVENGWFHRLIKDADGEQYKTWRFPTWTNPFIKADEVEELRRTLPSLTFRREIAAEYVSAAGALVPASWLKHVDRAPEGIRKALGVDLAISQREGADYTAIVAYGETGDGIGYVLDALRGRWTFKETMEQIVRMAGLHRPEVVAIEKVAYQEALIQELRRVTNLPVKAVPVNKDKATRALPLIGRYEHGYIYHLSDLPGWFEQELLSFPVGEHDDAVDALVHAHGAVHAAPVQIFL